MINVKSAYTYLPDPVLIVVYIWVYNICLPFFFPRVIISRLNNSQIFVIYQVTYNLCFMDFLLLDKIKIKKKKLKLGIINYVNYIYISNLYEVICLIYIHTYKNVEWVWKVGDKMVF